MYGAGAHTGFLVWPLGDIEGSIPISPGPKLKLAFFEPKFASLHSTIRVDVNVISR